MLAISTNPCTLLPRSTQPILMAIKAVILRSLTLSLKESKTFTPYGIQSDMPTPAMLLFPSLIRLGLTTEMSQPRWLNNTQLAHVISMMATFWSGPRKVTTTQSSMCILTTMTREQTYQSQILTKRMLSQSADKESCTAAKDSLT